MTTAATPLVAVICEDDAVVATALAHTLRDLYGMRVAATVRTAAAALVAAASIQPNLVVIDLALTGQRGLRIVPELHEAAPGCAVVVCAPPEFVDLRLDAVASGAVTLVKASDVRPLHCSVERLISMHGENCSSCAAREREAYWRQN